LLRAPTNRDIKRATESTAAGSAPAVPSTVEPNPGLVAPLPTVASTAEEFRFSKRIFDVVVSSLAIVLLAPFLLLVALLVKLDSPGPVFFRSPRIRCGDERFLMLKFRTMVDGSCEQQNILRHLSEAPDGLFKIPKDPRITRVGRVLRALCLDELPQLFHVLTGTMSLVGPRPLPPEEDALLTAAGLRTHARPGITGPWQVAGSWRVPLSEMVELDNEYLANWSIWGDVKLIGRTAFHVARRAGV
jgi:lipopolysaccharide/colanic/teichoic acid biosynthesis glycosyltransferase